MTKKFKGKLVYGPRVSVKGIMGYSNIFEPGQNEDGTEGKYSVTVAIPKTETKIIKELRKACLKAAKDKYKDKPIPYSFIKDPLRDGDEPNQAGKMYKGLMGCYYIKAKSSKKPGAVKVINGVPHPLSEEELYTGSKIRVLVTPFVYTMGTGGVSFFFQIVRKLADGKQEIGYWECTKDEETGKVIKGKFVEGGIKEEEFTEEDEYEEVDVRSEFDDDEEDEFDEELA
jgi:hypothetical protein